MTLAELRVANQDYLRGLATILVRDRDIADRVVAGAFDALEAHWQPAWTDEKAAAYLRCCTVNGAGSALRRNSP